MRHLSAFIGVLLVLAAAAAAHSQEGKPAAKPRPINHPENPIKGGIIVGDKKPVTFDGFLRLSGGENGAVWSRGKDRLRVKVGQKVKDVPLSDIRIIRVTERDKDNRYHWLRGTISAMKDKEGREVPVEFVDVTVRAVTVRDKTTGEKTRLSPRYVRAITTVILWQEDSIEQDVTTAAHQRTPMREGMLAPVFSVKSLNKGAVDTRDYIGKKNLLIVFSPNGANTSQAPEINRIQRKYAGVVKIIVIKQYVPMGRVGEAWIRGMKINYPIISDNNRRFEGKITRLFGVKAVPVVFYINKDGGIAHIGPSRPDHSSMKYMENKLVELWGTGN